VSEQDNILNFAYKIFKFPRSLTGDGVRKTLLEIKKIIPGLKIKSIKSKTKVFDWKIPLEWKVNDAYILDPKKNKICEFKKNNLHLVGYSIPIKKKLNKNILLEKLYSLPKQPNAIPYLTSYYKRDWGFCISHNQKKKLIDGNYKVFIDTKLFRGKMNYGEIILKGKLKKEVLLSTYICHPSMANNEVSGPSVLTFLTKWLKSLDKKYTYRIIFIPETIGSIAYIHKNLERLKKNFKYGFIITCVGDQRNYSFLPSKYENSLSDKIALKTLKSQKIKFKKYNWLDRGSDERQFCSPLVDLPVCSIMRTKHGKYVEYHTSLDKIGKVVTKKGLFQSLNLYKKCILNLENLKLPVSNIPCEPQMGKRGLYPTLSKKIQPKFTRQLMNVLSYCDGTNTLDDISKYCKIKNSQTSKIIKILFNKKIITFE